MEIRELEAKIARDRNIDLSRKMSSTDILNELAMASVKESLLINEEAYKEQIQLLQVEVSVFLILYMQCLIGIFNTKMLITRTVE